MSLQQSPQGNEGNPQRKGSIPSDHPISKLLGRELDDLLYVVYQFGFNEVRAVRPRVDNKENNPRLRLSVDASQVRFPVEVIDICLSDNGIIKDTSQLKISVTLECSHLIKTEERESLVSALCAHSPRELDGNTLQITQILPLADLVPTCELIFSSIHNSSGLTQNMTVARMAQVILELPELNRRTVRQFDRRINNGLGEFPKKSGKRDSTSDSDLIQQIRDSRDLIRAHGRLVLFQLSDDLETAGILSLTSGTIRSYLTVNLPDRLTIDTLREMAEEFLASKDLLGLVGAVSIIAENSQFSIEVGATSPEDSMDDYYSIGMEALSFLGRFSGEPMAATQARRLEIAFNNDLDRTAFNALLAPVKDSVGITSEDSVPPYVNNRRLIWQELDFIEAQIPASISDTAADLLSQKRGDEALLIKLAYLNPDLMEDIALIVDSREPHESSLIIADRVLNTVTRRLSREGLEDLSSTIDYLASQFARHSKISGFNHEFGINRLPNITI